MDANKIRTFHNDQIIVGFAGSTADALALFDRLEKKCEEFSYNLKRACVELAKDWRTDRYLRRLESMIIAADKSETFLISGTGDVLEPQEGIVAIGSGGVYLFGVSNDQVEIDKVIDHAKSIKGVLDIINYIQSI